MSHRGPSKNFWEHLEEYPPCSVRLLARLRRHKGRGYETRALGDVEVAMRSGLSEERVKEISHLLSWDDVPLIEMRAFLKGCNFDPTDSKDRNRATAYKNQGLRYRYLTESAHWKDTFLPIVQIVQAYEKSA